MHDGKFTLSAFSNASANRMSKIYENMGFKREDVRVDADGRVWLTFSGEWKPSTPRT